VATRNLSPNLKLPAPPEKYDQDEQAKMRAIIEKHWHPQVVSSGTGDPNVTVLLPIDNGVDPLQDGAWATAIVTFPYSIVGYRIIEDSGVSGSVVVKVQYADNVAFPTFTDISGTDIPTISSGHAHESTALTGWTTSGLANSQLRAVVVGAATNITRIVLALALQKA
jgi:hypothetical protein